MRTAERRFDDIKLPGEFVMESFWQDLRHSLRLLWSRLGFTVTYFPGRRATKVDPIMALRID